MGVKCTAFCVAIFLSCLVTPLLSEAQQTARLGFISSSTTNVSSPFLNAL